MNQEITLADEDKEALALSGTPVVLMTAAEPSYLKAHRLLPFCPTL